MTDSNIDRIKRDLDAIDMHIDRLLAIKEAYDHIVSRDSEAREYCDKYLRVEAWGRNIWHAVLDDAIRLREALEDSVHLQSHYAELLNMHDGGQRIGFENADAWLKRLKEIKNDGKRDETPS